ncbi:MAG: DUF2786 domain-containing protein [Desulfurivibrio sp.]|nr:DUF2786 domain-containing protein [Desulfurivibrio sp.]
MNIQAWQRQLLQEHEQLCWYYRLKLPTPLFRIADGLSRAGSWSPQPHPGIITIAEHLIREHGWQVVIEVLKHEMCHQYVDSQTKAGATADPPHGAAFQQACRQLGVHPAFRRAQSEIPHLLQGAKGEPAAPAMLARVEKLLALAASANEHEAGLAMRKAGELIRKHNLQWLTTPGPESAYDYLVIDSGRLRQPPPPQPTSRHPEGVFLRQDHQLSPLPGGP